MPGAWRASSISRTRATPHARRSSAATNSVLGPNSSTRAHTLRMACWSPHRCAVRSASTSSAAESAAAAAGTHPTQPCSRARHRCTPRAQESCTGQGLVRPRHPQRHHTPSRYPAPPEKTRPPPPPRPRAPSPAARGDPRRAARTRRPGSIDAHPQPSAQHKPQLTQHGQRNDKVLASARRHDKMPIAHVAQQGLELEAAHSPRFFQRAQKIKATV